MSVDGPDPYDYPYGENLDERGRPRYFSATQLTAGDPTSYAGCVLRWWYKYVAKKPEPKTKGMDIGTELLHKPLEAYYKTGAPLTPLALSGLRFLYERGDDLLIEGEVSVPPTLYVANTLIVGKIDLGQERGTFLDSAGELRAEADPASTLELNDWKSTSSFEYAKTVDQLLDTVQMNLYAGWGFQISPDAEQIRLSHTYFLTRGKAASRKVTGLVDRERVSRKMEYLDSIGRTLIDVSAETDEKKIPGNRQSCNAYRGGCPHRSYCPVGSHNSIGGLVAIASKKESPAMSLLKKALTPPVTTLPAPDVGVSVNMIAALEAEEKAKLAAKAAAAHDPAVIAALQMIENAGMGHPVYTGEVARARAFITKSELKSDALTGSGTLAGLDAIGDAAKVVQLASELQAHCLAQGKDISVTQVVAAPVVEAPKPAPVVAKVVHNTPPIAVLPPDVPESVPALAADPVAGLPAPGGVVAQPITTSTLTAAAGGPVPEMKKPKAKKEAPAPMPVPAPSKQETSDGGRVELFLDCVPSKPANDLQPFIDHVYASLVEYYKPDPPDVQCCSDKGSPLAFGGWKGCAEALTRQLAPELPAGAYIARSSEKNLPVVMALRQMLCKPGDFTQGIR